MDKKSDARFADSNAFNQVIEPFNKISRNSVLPMNVAPPKVLYQKPFSMHNSHGGAHRSEQITDILYRHNIEILEFGFSEAQKTRPIRDRWLGARNAWEDKDWTAFKSRRLGSVGRVIHAYEKILPQASKGDVLLWESTSETVTPKLAKKYKLPVIALPQNLESFWHVKYFDLTENDIFTLLRCETDALKASSFTFTISLEEKILLRNLGVNADYLPYYPSSNLLPYFLNIRAQRLALKADRNTFLILGSAINPFTVDGIIELVDWLRTINLPPSFCVELVGRNTEIFQNTLNEPWLKIHGTVSNQELEQLLISARVVFAHQKQGLGALTKIPEMLIAGIPVIANEVAARSAKHLPGVYVYNSMTELQALIDQELPEVPIPSPPEQAEKRFINALWHCVELYK